jgi:hypothetical protein
MFWTLVLPPRTNLWNVSYVKLILSYCVQFTFIHHSLCIIHWRSPLASFLASSIFFFLHECRFQNVCYIFTIINKPQGSLRWQHIYLLVLIINIYKNLFVFNRSVYGKMQWSLNNCTRKGLSYVCIQLNYG